MGGSQSTRQVVLDNPSMVNITEDVQRRLMGLPEQQQPESQEAGRPMTNEQIEVMRKQIENEYRQRITDKSSENNRIRAEEFARAVQEVESKFLKQSGGPLCQDLQQEVYECYQDHRKEPLRCSNQVRAFTNAIEKARRNAIMTELS